MKKKITIVVLAVFLVVFSFIQIIKIENTPIEYKYRKEIMSIVKEADSMKLSSFIKDENDNFELYFEVDYFVSKENHNDMIKILKEILDLTQADKNNPLYEKKISLCVDEKGDTSGESISFTYEKGKLNAGISVYDMSLMESVDTLYPLNEYIDTLNLAGYKAVKVEDIYGFTNLKKLKIYHCSHSDGSAALDDTDIKKLQEHDPSLEIIIE